MGTSLARELKEAARRLGFDLAGITTADPLARSHCLATWVAAGHHGEMDYLADTVAERADPGRFLPGAASVLCVAMAYHDGPIETATGSGSFQVGVAAYAARRDYHTVIRSRLVRLGRMLSAWVPGAHGRLAVDTAPLAEKALAERAGLGWIGANTLLLNRDLGSQLLLGELVTDLPLHPDDPGSSQCDSCTACLSACPTRALVAPGLIDARRCIAYLTIEHRSAFSAEEAALLGDHLFGCDLCQVACPWNARATPRCDPALAVRPELLSLGTDYLLGLDAPGWRHLTAGTPLRRLDAARLARNLDAVFANRCDTSNRIT
jgi:epoxyqueuosine reductase